MTQQKPQIVSQPRCPRCKKPMRQLSRQAYHCASCDAIHTIRKLPAPIQFPPNDAA